jgi:hypothetical protein
METRPLQTNSLGALAVMACDGRCRERLLAIHPGLDQLVRIARLCLAAPHHAASAATDHSALHSGVAMHTAVYVVAAVVIRDADGRRSVATAGALPSMLPDLNSPAMQHPAVLHAAAMAAAQYAREPSGIRLLASCGAAAATAVAMVRLAEWAAPRLPSATGAHAEELPLQVSV